MKCKDQDCNKKITPHWLFKNKGWCNSICEFNYRINRKKNEEVQKKLS